MEDIGGSTVKGYSDYCDGGSDVESGITPIKTRLLRKGQSCGSNTMLEILEDLYILYFFMRKYTSMPYIGGISVRYK